MMKLSRRIRDLVRSGLASPSQFARTVKKARSPARMEAQLEQIRKSLARAAVREKQLQDDLAQAEQQGRERDVVRIRRELVGLAESADELQKTLDLIEARIEIDQERKEDADGGPFSEISVEAAGLEAKAADLEAEAAHLEAEAASSQTSRKDKGDDTDLAARKARLTSPEKG